MLSPAHEVYPHAPLRLVTAEFRFPISPALSGEGLLKQLARVLGDRLPVIEPAAGAAVNNFFLGTPAGPSRAFGGSSVFQPPMIDSGYRMLSRDRTASVTVAQGRLAVETTAYGHWENFRDELVLYALDAIGGELRAIAGLDRVGVRYINEIGVPGSAVPGHRWNSYIHSQLIAPIQMMHDFEVTSSQGALELGMGDDRELQMRYGTTVGRIVSDQGPLRLPTSNDPGPYFFIDIDSYWTRTGVMDEFDVDSALNIAEALHDPVSSLFERSITDRLRNEVLREAALNE